MEDSFFLSIVVNVFLFALFLLVVLGVSIDMYVYMSLKLLNFKLQQ